MSRLLPFLLAAVLVVAATPSQSDDTLLPEYREWDRIFGGTPGRFLIDPVDSINWVTFVYDLEKEREHAVDVYTNAFEKTLRLIEVVVEQGAKHYPAKVESDRVRASIEAEVVAWELYLERLQTLERMYLDALNSGTRAQVVAQITQTRNTAIEWLAQFLHDITEAKLMVVTPETPEWHLLQIEATEAAAIQKAFELANQERFDELKAMRERDLGISDKRWHLGALQPVARRDGWTTPVGRSIAFEAREGLIVMPQQFQQGLILIHAKGTPEPTRKRSRMQLSNFLRLWMEAAIGRVVSRGARRGLEYDFQ